MSETKEGSGCCWMAAVIVTSLSFSVGGFLLNAWLTIKVARYLGWIP